MLWLVVERQVEGYSTMGGSGSGTQVSPEMMKVFKILVPETTNKASTIEGVVAAINVAAAHCAAKRQKSEPLNK